MHIVMLSDWETAGGAAISTSRLATTLCHAGHQVTRIVAYADSRSHLWTTIPLAHYSVGSRVARRLRSNLVRDVVLHRETRLFFKNQMIQLRPDIINIHNIHGGGWPFSLIDLWAQCAPIAWTLHDTWSFTGRCAYMYDCQKFITGCDASCPTPDEYPSLAPERIALAWQQRKIILGQHPSITAISPSHWLADTAKRGLWKNHAVEIIPYGLPLDLYRPIARIVARTALDIPTDKPVLLIVAQDLNDRRKGVHFLLESIEQVLQPITLLTLGAGSITVRNQNVTVQNLGYVNDERIMMLAYNAADMLVHPAPVDNLPNVVLEAIACGTPVVGFSIGGIPDMVRRGQTGWLANDVSSTSLTSAIIEALTDITEGRDWRSTCRAVAEERYAASTQAKSYIQLFSSLGLTSTRTPDKPTTMSSRALHEPIFGQGLQE